ncbi:MAG: hypothetical protein ACLQDV_30020 [Candidatus Binataceae bacterium]
MGDFVSYIAHLGPVRVLFVPILMGLAIYWMWRLAAPPPWEDDSHRS